MDAYDAAHRACPECGSTHYSSTYEGFMMNVDQPDLYVDGNKAVCMDCGWSGIVHDLVPRKPESVLV
jgi:hypothetical protein